MNTPENSAVDLTVVAREIAGFLRHRFPQLTFDTAVSHKQVIIQAVTEPADIAGTNSRCAPSDDASIGLALDTSAVSFAPGEIAERRRDCATCIAEFLQQHASQGGDCYTPVQTFLEAFIPWLAATGQTPFSEAAILAALTANWALYLGGRDGWILDGFTVTYP